MRCVLCFVCLLSALVLHARADDVNESFLKWVTENGGKVGSVTIKTKDDGERGLFATKPIAAGAIAVEVPISLAMCPTDFGETSLGKALLADNELAKSVALDERGLLAVMLLGEKSVSSSKWAPYLSSMPKEVGAAAGVVVDAKTLGSLLEGSIVKDDVVTTVNAVQRLLTGVESFFANHSSLVKSFYPEISTSPERVSWAVSMVMSRTTTTLGAGQPHCMVPLMDMMNHRPGAHPVAVSETAENTLQQTAKKAIPSGGEVFSNYGVFPGHLAIAQYGFVSAEMGWNLAHKMRDILTTVIEGENPAHGAKHAENVAVQVLKQKCQALDSFAAGGVIGWSLLRKVMQCSRIISCGPMGLEILVRRQIKEPRISERPFDFGAETKALETWMEYFMAKQADNAKGLKRLETEASSKEVTMATTVLKSERLFILGHLKEIKRLYSQSEHLGDYLEAEQEKWEKEDDKQRQFRLTDTIEDVQQRKDEDARVEKELAGDFSAEDLVSAGIHQPEDRPPGRRQGSHHDEF